MDSSTSSSRERIPADYGPRTWLVAGLLALAVLAGWEGFWRARGVVPSARDSDVAWVLARERVGPRSVVLLGASRMQTDVDPALLARLLSRPVVQLAAVGSSPVPVLEDLAADPDFRGVALVGVVPRIVFDATRAREWEARRRVELHAQGLSPASRAEAPLTRLVQSLFASRREDLTAIAVLHRALRLQLPRLPFVGVRDDRFRALDFTLVPPGPAARNTAAGVLAFARPMDAAEVGAQVERIGRAVDALRARGGRVLFVNLPSDGPVREAEEQRFPRGRFWDPLAAQVPALHYEDVPELRFSCPDGSHVDRRDVAALTDALARQLHLAR